MDPMVLIAYGISILLPLAAIYAIFFLDMFGTGKGSTVGTSLLWGLLGSFALAYLVNTQMQSLFDLPFQTISTRTAPIVEELLKALILIYFIRQPRFRYFVDGAVYGYAAGIGFAISENIFYVAHNPTGAEGVLTLAISRGLSAALMHAAASAIVGISFGMSRRSTGFKAILEPALGIFLAVLLHFIYNNALFALATQAPLMLLLVGVGIGLGGGGMIAFFIRWGLAEEQKRFADALDESHRISGAEVRAIQNLGSPAIDAILEEMAVIFGEEKAFQIQDMLVLQANIGILRNNLTGSANEHLRKAWQVEVDQMTLKIDEIRLHLGTYVMTLLRSLLPEDDLHWNEFMEEMAAYDPLHVHSFDLFVVGSELAETISPERLEEIANRLKEINLFHHVEFSELESLSRAIQFKTYQDKELLFDKGDEGDYMYIIERGFIDIILIEEAGDELFLRSYEQGAVVGELALLDGQPRSARAKANGTLSTMRLQRQHFKQFFQSRSHVQLAILEFLCERVRFTTDEITIDDEKDYTDYSDSDHSDLSFIDGNLVFETEAEGLFAALATAFVALESAPPPESEN